MNIAGTREAISAPKSAGRSSRTRCSSSARSIRSANRTFYVAPDGFPLQSLGTVPSAIGASRPTRPRARGRRQPTQRIDASFFGDPAHGDNGPQRYTALLNPDTSAFSGWTSTAGTTRRSSTRLDPWQVAGRGIVRAGSEQSRRGAVGRSVVGHRRHGRPASAVRRHRVLRGRQPEHQLAISARRSTNLIGDHQIHYGVLAEHLDYLNTINRTGPTFTLPNGVQTTTGAEIDILSDPTYGQIYRVVRANTSNVRDTSAELHVVLRPGHLEDRMRVTINPGLRYERQALTGTLTNLYARATNGRRGSAPPGIPKGNGAIEGVRQLGPVLPRMPNDLAARALSADAGVSRADYFDAALTQPIPDGTLAGRTRRRTSCSRASRRDVIDPTVKAMYVNEVIAGVEYRCWPGINVGVRYIHRDIPRVLEDVQPFPDGRRSTSASRARQSIDYMLTNPGPIHRGAGRFRRVLRDADSPLQRPRGHRGQAAVESVDTAGVVPLLAAARHLRGVLSRRQRPVGSGDLPRCSTSRPTIRATRRSASRSSAIAATSVFSARSAQVRCRSIVRTRSRCSAATSSTWG